jgi:hypothetical protein
MEIFAFLAVVAVVGYYFWHKKAKSKGSGGKSGTGSNQRK